MTAGEVIDRIRKNLGAPWRDATYRDTFKFGGPDTTVTGIATTAFVTLDVIQKAGAAGLEHDHSARGHLLERSRRRDLVSGDPLYQAKVDVMRKHNIVVFRMHDHMHVQRPDFTYVGSARAIGLDAKDETAPSSHRFVIPATTLGALAADIQRRTGARALRVVGDPNAKVSRIQLGVGYAIAAGQRRRRRRGRSAASAGSRWRLRQPGLRARRRGARHGEGLDRAGTHHLRGGRHAGDGGLDQGLRARGPGAAGQSR